MAVRRSSSVWKEPQQSHDFGLCRNTRKKKLLEEQASPAERLSDRIGLLFGVASKQQLSQLSCFIAQLKVAGLRPAPSHAVVRVLDIFCAGVIFRLARSDV